MAGVRQRDSILQVPQAFCGLAFASGPDVHEEGRADRVLLGCLSHIKRPHLPMTRKEVGELGSQQRQALRVLKEG